MTDERDNIIKIFLDRKIIWEQHNHGPHAAYDMADKHSGYYFNSDLAIMYPDLRRIAASYLASFVEDTQDDYWVFSYFASISASLALATEISTILGKRLGYFNIATGKTNFPILERDKILIVVDDIHSGGSIRKMLTAFKYANCNVIPTLLTLGNFSNKDDIDGLHIRSIVRRPIESWPAASCPLCTSGSRVLSARSQWKELTSADI
ncbi:MAG: hypothetical protein PUP91_03500 [Rhizonema sp. PD37]|nr:hypothetical protein [Rhizonema sp. PD37]